MFKISGAMKEGLLRWYQKTKRELPWRQTSDPYRIWISEIILQQTRVDQGLSYYQRFLETFPDVLALAGADEDEVLKCWQGLGYYTRARNLHHTAKEVAHQNRGRFPDTYEGLLALKGIGPYTAAAIASIAFNRVHPVCDGNVERVVCRYLALYGDPKSPAVRNQIEGFLNEHIDRRRPGDFNQAMMELGALVCKPAAPECTLCPLHQSCQAARQRLTAELPVRKIKKTNPVRHFYYLVVRTKGTSITWVHKRQGQDIWKGLYEFPLIETDKAVSTGVLKKSPAWEALLGNIALRVNKTSPQFTHHLSHRELRIRFLHIETEGIPVLPTDMEKIAWDELRSYPVPVVIARYLQTL